MEHRIGQREGMCTHTFEFMSLFSYEEGRRAARGRIVPPGEKEAVWETRAEEASRSMAMEDARKEDGGWKMEDGGWWMEGGR